ncbi:MAG TPA: MerR family transcriptional regulator [Saprospiraceae bacterium]|nr:MerR family transcriptional regulator [Saprospiraceae bacterium]
MDSFSIGDLQQYSGIKAHTIRIWEQRYQALQPHRSVGNTRLYDSQQLRRLLNIVSLIDENHKVSTLCTLPDRKLNDLLRQRLESVRADHPMDEYFISQLIASALTYDEPQFSSLYGACVQKLGLRYTYIQVLYPTLVRLGLMWTNEDLRPPHEHFITHLMQQKILAAVDSLPLPKSKDRVWLLFLPENEFHELGLLFAHYLLRQAGQQVIYLGPNLPEEALRQAASTIHPTHLLGFMVHRNDPETDAAYLRRLSKAHKGSQILIACDPTRPVVSPLKNLRFLHSVQDLETAFQKS